MENKINDCLIQIFYQLHFTKTESGTFVVDEYDYKTYLSFVNAICEDKRIDTNQNIYMYVFKDASELYIYDANQEKQSIFVTENSPEFLNKEANIKCKKSADISHSMNRLFMLIKLRKDKKCVQTILDNFIRLAKCCSVYYSTYVFFYDYADNNKPISFTFSDDSVMFMLNYKQANNQFCYSYINKEDIYKYLSLKGL